MQYNIQKYKIVYFSLNIAARRGNGADDREDRDICGAYDGKLRVTAAFGDFLRRVGVHAVGHQRVGPQVPEAFSQKRKPREPARERYSHGQSEAFYIHRDHDLY